MRHLRCAGVLALGLLASPGLAQVEDPTPHAAEKVESMGQPLTLKPYALGLFAWDRDVDATGFQAAFGVYKDLLFPVSGGLGLSVEGYGGAVGGRYDGGMRFFINTKLFYLGFGWDWNFRENRVNGVIAFTPPLRRGGLFGLGGNLRVEWIGSRSMSWRFGYQLPLEPHMGKTRQKKLEAALPKPPPAPPATTLPAQSSAALQDVQHAGRWLVANANLFSDEGGSSYAEIMEKFRAQVGQVKEAFAQTDARHPRGHTFVQESRHYHEAFDRAFVAAVGPERGRAVAEEARAILLDDVLLPYDRLIGRFKTPDTLKGFAAAGRLRFGRTLDGIDGLSGAQRAAALGVLDRLVEMFEQARQVTRDHWDGDERHVWLPLTLAVRGEDHDSQAELEALIERALERPFAPGTAVFPTSASRFQLELVRSIRAAEDYHVLWIHDYAGKVDGDPDPVAHAVSVEYLKTLARRVREYDQTGRLPAYMIFNTEFFYDGSAGRLFLTLLEKPLSHPVRLGKKHREMEREIEEAQEELRQAVAGSERLQDEARENGQYWIQNVVKVHVSVTHIADLSFRTHKLHHWIPIAPDSLMLDHRKLFFYDVTEADPRRGEACFTGTGVGSEYAGPTWQDRGILVSGPSLLELKSAARRLLLSQGFDEDEIPTALRPSPRPTHYADLVQELEESGRNARGLNVHNEVGFAPKENTLVQSILYTMAPADTVFVVPDSIWASPQWAGQLVGASLRGCHVYAVAPSGDNAPASGLSLLARTREIFGRILEAEQTLHEEIAREGGHLRVGLYTRAAKSDDNLSAIREMAERVRENPWLIEEFPMPRDIVGLLEEMGDELEAQGYEPQFIAPGTREGRPKMHRKTQFFATRRALREVADMPALSEGLRQYIEVDSRGTADPASLLEAGTPLGPAGPVLTRLNDDPPPGARDALYFLTVGSKNQDPRSAVLDGETSYVVAGPWSLVYYPDFMLLMANTTWIDKHEQFEELLPGTDEGARKFGRFIRGVL